jgi:hypothetical protein
MFERRQVDCWNKAAQIVLWPQWGDCSHLLTSSRCSGFLGTGSRAAVSGFGDRDYSLPFCPGGLIEPMFSTREFILALMHLLGSVRTRAHAQEIFIFE